MAFSVLMIEDDLSFQKILEKRLKSFIPEMTVTHFDNITEAREFLSEQKKPYFDLVILDEHLPDGRGVEILSEGWFEDLAVLSISSDEDPQTPGALVQAGAAYFLAKTSISQPLFRPLVEGVIDRNNIQKELLKTKVDSAIIDTVKTLAGTLRHEINNPLGAVLGAAFILKMEKASEKERNEAIELVEASGQRIKHVLDQLCAAVEVEPVKKADQTVFHIPGDEPWEDEEGGK